LQQAAPSRAASSSLTSLPSSRFKTPSLPPRPLQGAPGPGRPRNGCGCTSSSLPQDYCPPGPQCRMPDTRGATALAAGKRRQRSSPATRRSDEAGGGALVIPPLLGTGKGWERAPSSLAGDAAHAGCVGSGRELPRRRLLQEHGDHVVINRHHDSTHSHRQTAPDSALDRQKTVIRPAATGPRPRLIIVRAVVRIHPELPLRDY
jgi:hypothetical protein